jgi:hypothetical protein
MIFDYLNLFIAFVNFVTMMYNFWNIKLAIASVDRVINTCREKTASNPPDSGVEIHSDLGRRLLEIQRGRYSKPRGRI